MPYRHSAAWLVIFAVIALMFLQLPHLAARQDAVIRTYAPLVEVDALARQKYVEPVDASVLVGGAIRGMLRELDPYSSYLAPNQLRAFEERSRGEFIGIGLELGIRDGRVTVIAPIEGGPALQAGVLPGDVIIEINGHDTEGLSLLDIESILQAAGSDAVALLVERKPHRNPMRLSVRPGPVSLHTVRGFSRDESGSWRHDMDRTPNIAYIRISAFLENTTRDFEDALRSVHRSGAKALVLDLRFNPGGLMTEAVQVVDRFLHSGLIVATVSRRKAEQEYFATEDDISTDMELAVLINGASASASEIVAGALQDHGRAIVIGERSFGKGSVQRLIHLVESGGAVKLTTAYYRLPKGRFIHRNATDDASDAWGIVPDIEVSLSPEIAERIQSSRRELDVRTPLTQPCSAALRDDLPEVGNPCLFIDPQFAAAIAALRSQMSGNDLDTAWLTDDSTP